MEAKVGITGELESQGGLPSLTGGAALRILRPIGRREGGMPMVTYADLFQLLLLIVSLIGLCYAIFKGKR